MTWIKGGGRGLYRNTYMSEIKEIAYSYVPWYEKRRLTQKNQIGNVIVQEMLPLFLDTIKSLLQSM